MFSENPATPVFGDKPGLKLEEEEEEEEEEEGMELH